MWEFRFSYWCCWGFMSSGMWHYAVGLLVPIVLKASRCFRCWEPFTQWQSITPQTTRIVKYINFMPPVIPVHKLSKECKLRSWRFSISWVWFRSTLFQGLAVLLSSGDWKNVLLLYPLVGYKTYKTWQRFPHCIWGATGYLKKNIYIYIYIYFCNLCVLVFQMATKLLGQIVIKLFGPNCLLNRSVRYFFWPRDSVNW
jgi:hypothetical protein